jgi:hypothetical protein
MHVVLILHMHVEFYHRSKLNAMLLCCSVCFDQYIIFQDVLSELYSNSIHNELVNKEMNDEC